MALRAVAGVLADGRRSGDTCYRYGGEQFLCVFPEQSVEGAAMAVQRVLTQVVLLAIPHAGSPDPGVLTVSAGIAQMTRECSAPGAVQRRADETLHRAKAAGRNAVRTATIPVPTARLRATASTTVR